MARLEAARSCANGERSNDLHLTLDAVPLKNALVANGSISVQIHLGERAQAEASHVLTEKRQILPFPSCPSRVDHPRKAINIPMTVGETEGLISHRHILQGSSPTTGLNPVCPFQVKCH